MRRGLLIAGGVAAGLTLAGAACAVVVLVTAPGRDLLRRAALRLLAGSVDGQVRIGRVGTGWRALELYQVELAGADGRPVIRADRVRSTIAITDILRRRFRFTGVTLVRPVVVLEQDTTGVWNVQRLFRLDRPDTGPPRPRPLVEVRNATVENGTLVVIQHRGADSVIERRATGLGVHLSRLLASHPDTSGVRAAFSALAASVSNPAVTLREAAGTVVVEGQAITMALARLELPGTRGSLTGTLGWGSGRTTFDLSVEADAFTFADLRGAAPALPERGGGRASLRARGSADGSVGVELREFEFESGRSTATARGQLTIGPRGGVALRGLSAGLYPLDLELVAAYVDTLPLRGLVRGTVRLDGAPRDLAVAGDVTFTDAGGAVNVIAGAGRLGIGGEDQLVFRRFQVRVADIAPASLGRYLPGVPLTGRLRLEGQLDGAWRAVRWEGALAHVGDSAGEETSARGRAELSIGDSAAVNMDLSLDSLSLDLVRRTFPRVPVGGTFAGRLRLNGPVAGMALDATLLGAAGDLRAIGRVGLREGIVNLTLDGTFDSLDVHRLRTEAPPSELSGAFGLDLALPTDSSGPAASGVVRLSLRPGSLAGIPVLRGGAALRLEPALLALDSLRLVSPAGLVTAAGSLGRGRGPVGQATFMARSDTLGYLEPLVRWYRSRAGDTALVRFDGAGELGGRVTGGADRWTASGTLTLTSIAVAGAYARGLRAQGELRGGGTGTPRFEVQAAADSAAWAALAYTPLGLRAAGTRDSVGVTVSAGFARTAALRAQASIWGDSVMRVVTLDSIRLELPSRVWHLARPAAFAVTGDAMVFDTVELLPVTGTGRVAADGVLPRAGVGDFRLAVESLAVGDLFSLANRDTAGVGGALDLAVRVAGAAETPSIEASLVLVDGRFGETRLPLVQVLARYGDRLFTMKGGLWRDDVRLVALNGAAPVDLSLSPVERRRLPGPLQLSARSDSVPLSVFDPLTDLVSELAGAVSLDVEVRGTWDDYRPSGFLEIHDGTMRVPSLGARYTGMDVRLDLQQDSVIRVTRGRLRSGEGTLDVAGHYRLVTGALDSLALELHAVRFPAFDLRDYAGLTATGDLTLAGPLLGATLRGSLTVDQGYLRFADLVQKRVVSLDDPEFRAIVDSNLARAAGLGPEFRTVFADSLRIDSLTLTMGPEVWMRSNEANIQLDGRFTVDRSVEGGLPRYRMDGTLRTVRGNYRLVLGQSLGPGLAKDFRVTGGAVRFYGTPDFNPDLEIRAEHVMRTVQGSQLTVLATIGGTLLYPRLRLASDQRPPLTETEIVSYLLFGGPPSNAEGPTQALLQGALSGIAGEVGQSLITELGLPLDYLTILPGSDRSRSTSASFGSSLGASLSTARVGAGAQLSERTFLTLTAGLCEVLTTQLVGASVEYRLSRPFTVSAAFEPLSQECGTAASLSGLSARYQFSFDLFWQSGFR